MTDHTEDGGRGDDGRGDGRSTRPAEFAYEIGDDERPSTAVVRAVASLTNTAVLDLDPLYDAVDPAHVDELAAGTGSRGSITFGFEGCRVTVAGDVVHVEAREA